MKFKFCIYLVVQLIGCSATTLKFEEITGEIFPLGENIGIIAAFGHFNSDEYTDVVSLQQGGHKLQLFKGSENRPYFQSSLNCSFADIITSVVPGDYNGDSQLDLLITLSKSNNEHSELMILWGSNGSIHCTSDTVLSLVNQPFVVDFNGDMIPDIIGDDIKDEKRHVWISSTDKKFHNHNLTNVIQKMRKTHSSGLIDLNNDMAADFLITGEIYIESWINTGKGFVLNQTKIPYPHKIEWLWQSTFVDMNLDGKMNHIMPVCKDRKCHESEILIWNENQTKWEVLFSDFMNPNDKTVWGFKLPMGAALEMAALQVTLRAGDVDMDGYPDFITVLQSKKVATDVQAVIMRNIPCSNNCSSGRTLEIVWDVQGLKDIPNVQIAAFFDLFEDGTLDILVSNHTKQEWKIYALRNTEIFDSCFLKVLVLGGLCLQNCSVDPYGTNQPGPVVRYNMTTQDGKPLVSSSIQLSQSAHFPLQLPYSLFGLGQTPNFIDVLTVSIPAVFNKSVHKREWVQIIPNSQIVIIPHPPNDERKWVKRLFVTPSNLVFLTCMALIVTCIFLCLLVALLHWKERREDKKERMQDAYRFHFDAM
ncbi:T-cell immunomodulatory protein-like [Argiope bruennichi]|uniref:T-cell immunomodulatory protein like n=1 Tax=Argiope bruennichi TaxID=94029 RepID=A0A8T0EAK5_ARGBR|nr:T-cell immunomodulatory protein-like [Argiope bruennichi]KAF8770142.1 T-cell immunomodulatory protein like [Argiope bruennichi]